jgi:glutaredoxin-like YruB-family protein
MPAKKEAMKVMIYSTPTCPYCKMAKEFLRQNKINFEDINVAADKQKAQEMIEKSGQMGVPVIIIDGKMIVGFDKEQLKKTLKLKE